MFNSPGKRTIAAMVDSLPETPVEFKRIEHNTLQWTDAKGCRHIRLHVTDILHFPKAGGFVITTGGWNTHTTRDRLNGYLPDGWGVATTRGVIHLWDRATGERHPFDTTITVTAKGKIKSDFKPAANQRKLKSVEKLVASYRTKGLPTVEQSGGDPWVFSRGKVDEYVMRDWLKGCYRTRKLMQLALGYSGMSDYGVAFTLARIDMDGGKLDRMALGRLRRYIRACIGRGA